MALGTLSNGQKRERQKKRHVFNEKSGDMHLNVCERENVFEKTAAGIFARFIKRHIFARQNQINSICRVWP